MLDLIVRVGASPTIGSYILPGEPLITLSQKLDSHIKLTVLNSEEIIEGIKNGIFDLGVIESAIFDDALIYTEWMEDELVVCSKTPLGDSIDKKKISRCQLLCREEESLTRQLITDFFSNHGLMYHHFDSLMEVDNMTSAIQSIKWSKPNRENPTVTIVSKLAIIDELERKELYFSRIEGTALSRKFYIIYDKKIKDAEKVQEIIMYFNAWRDANGHAS